jgi:DNA-directed RNA polymerase specialized sigma24 family protein
MRKLKSKASRGGRRLRYLGGLNAAEIAEVLKISPRTVRYDWSFARAWLDSELDRGGSDDA